ncbi:hypothetical protein [Streptacidiphilus anmyonensis]|uniref:hypothetical protein n=1 Tax=Streptacidiphilus anmyonensis TaxID=405782 RepID=UPI000693E103|nr:hypothetical protein [Streptacidiphilus anmyonensis]
MAQHRPVIHYMVTRPDGTVPPTCDSLAHWARTHGEDVPTVNLAQHVGETVDHPSPGEKWYTDKPFSYFHMYTRPGEVLELESTAEGWPVRLWIVEPRGETGNWGGRYYPYWLMSHQIHVVGETEGWRAFGHRGAQVLQTLAQIPDLAREWTAQWAADPQATHRTYTAWQQELEEHHALDWWAHFRAQYSRRTAALRAATRLAADSAGQAADAAGAGPETVTAIRSRARSLIAGQLLHDRIRTGEYERTVRALLLGDGLDHPAPVPA